MQRLLKFSCHQCGAKLAVPLQMAGLSDNCPKCGALVTSPTIPAEAAPVQGPATAPAKEEWSAEQLADALRPQTPKAPPVGIEKGPATGTPAAVPTKVPSANPATLAPRPPAPVPAPAPVPVAPVAPVAAAAPSAPVELPAPEILAPQKPEAAPSPGPFHGGPERAELSTGPNSEFPSASATAALAAAAAELAPERGHPMSTETAPALGEAPKAKTEPDLFGSAFPFPQAPQLNGLVPEESNLAPVAQESSAAPASRTPTSKGQEGRMRSKLQSISRLNTDLAPSAGAEGDRDRGPEPGPKTKSKIAPVTPPAAPAPEPEPESTVAPGASALVPDTLPDEETAEAAAQPGMGEVLTSGGAGGGSMLLPPHDARPWLYVPLVTVGSSPRRERRMRLNRIAMIGVVSFLMVDLLVVLWFCRKPIAAWFAGPPQTHGPAIPQAPPNERFGGEAVADSSAAVQPPRPEESPTTLAPTTQNPPPVAPEASKTAEDAPVPMAIPVTDFPGEPSQAAAPVAPAVPAAAPVVAATPPPAAMPAPAPAVVVDQPPGATPPPTLSEPVVASSTSTLPVPGAEVPTAMALANSSATAPPPPADLPPGLGAPAGLATAPGEVPYGGLPPPPADMALPNEPAPAEMSGPAVTLVTTPASSVKVSKLPREAQTALEVLQKFLDAPTWRDRMPYVQKADALKAALDKQPGQFSEGPIRVGQIDFVDRYVNKNGVPPYCMFELTGGSLEHPVLTLVEQSTKGGVRVDWEAFVDFKDSLLLKFLENQGASNSKFRVMLRRKHYFDKDVPEVSQKDAFEVKQPHGPFQGHIFVPKKSNLAQQLANQLGWGMDMPVIAELAWRTDGKHHWVEMVSISSYGWRG